MAQGRSVWGKAFRALLNSVRPRQMSGNLIGQDHMLNKYYEIPADPRGGKRTPSRWFEPSKADTYDQEIPAEWEAWLRGRRQEPPGSDEVLGNVALANLKKVNAKKVAQEKPFVSQQGHAGVEAPPLSQQPQFPVYDEYETPENHRRS